MTFTDVHPDRQKLGTILENKVVQKLKFSKNDNNKKPFSKRIFFNENFFRKIRTFFDIEKWLWKSDLGTFWQPVWTSVKVKSKKYFYFTDFFTKMKPLLTHVNKTPPLRSHLTIPLYYKKSVCFDFCSNNNKFFTCWTASLKQAVKNQ